MELDFDKYCVLDGSPTTVLPAPWSHSKVTNRKSSRKPKSGEETLSLKEDFSKVGFNHFHSASCRDARPRIPIQESNEGLKRGSVYRSSTDRKKIEFSNGNASAFPLGIIDSLCSSDEDTSIGERNSSSVMSASEQSTSSCEKQMEQHSWDPTENISPSDTCKKLPKVRRSVKGLMTISESSIAPGKDRKVSRERYASVNLTKSLSAKLPLHRSPSSSDVNGSKITPLRKMFDPFVRSKSHKSPSNCAEDYGLGTVSGQISSSSHNGRIFQSLLSDLSDKPLHADDHCQNGKKEKTSSSPAHLHGILKLESRQDGPIFVFSVKSPGESYTARRRKVDNALSTVYTFHCLHHRRKSKSSGWSFRDRYREATAIGQMHASCYLCTDINGKGDFDDSMVTEFVLYDTGHSRNSVSFQDNSVCSPDVCLSPPVVSNENVGQFKHSRHSYLFESSTSQSLGAAEMHPEQEIAAIVMQVPFKKRKSLKSSLLDPFRLEQVCEDSSTDASCPRTIHVVIPAGNHSLPSAEKSAPSPLLERWRLGGGCDCGGWDMACPLNVFANTNFQIFTDHNVMDHQQPVKLVVEGRKAMTPAFSMRAIEDGNYEVDFHAQLSSLQAFSICVAILHASKSFTSISHGSCQKNLQSDSLRVFAEEEIINLMDAIAEEEKCNPNKVKILPSFVLSPPFSPIARV